MIWIDAGQGDRTGFARVSGFAGEEYVLIRLIAEELGKCLLADGLIHIRPAGECETVNLVA